MKTIYRIILTINALILLGIVYLIKEGCFIVIDSFVISYAIYIMIAVAFTGACVFISRYLPKEIIEGGVVSVELANGEFMPTYMGYFFVALSINNENTLICVGTILIVLLYFSKSIYFNPLFCLFGYTFYNLKMNNGIEIVVITKRPIKSADGLSFNSLKRINDYTYIDGGRV